MVMISDAKDDADHAAEFESRFREGAIHDVRSKLPPEWMTADDSATECEECGLEIPQARREAMPGCKLCVHCQEYLDKKNKQYNPRAIVGE